MLLSQLSEQRRLVLDSAFLRPRLLLQPVVAFLDPNQPPLDSEPRKPQLLVPLLLQARLLLDSVVYNE